MPRVTPVRPYARRDAWVRHRWRRRPDGGMLSDGDSGAGRVAPIEGGQRTEAAAAALEVAAMASERGASIAEAAALMEAAADASTHGASRLRRLCNAGRLWVLAGAVDRAVGVLGRADARSDGDPDPGRFTIVLLGGFSITSDGGEVTPPPGMASQLVKMVALHDAVAVDEAVELLWPDAAPGVGRTRLRNVLSRLRSVTGDVVVRHNDQLRLAAGTVTDVAQFEAAAAKVVGTSVVNDPQIDAAALLAVQRYSGELLPADRFVPWTISIRQRLLRQYLAAVDAAAERASGDGRFADALVLLEDAIVADPYDETRYIRAGQILVTLGRRSGAAGMARQARAVAAQLGVPSSPDLVELEAQCRFGENAGIGTDLAGEMSRTTYS
jgi:DNA-binding SARP family transcriptional activator